MDERDQIKERIDIVDLISEYLPLKKAGTNFKANCPFHQEKTPSFMVSADKQIWHCFGCGKGGDIFTFLMEKEGMEFPEALRALAKRAGVEITPRNPQVWSRKNKLYEINNLVARYFHQAFLKSREADAARRYMQKRGFTPETLDRFLVGYSPDSWDILSQFLRKRDYRDEEIFAAGLTVRKDGGGCYDRFRGRLMFPIKNIHGDVVAFGARILKKDETGAKYINTPETEIYHKSWALYGLFDSRAAIRTAQQAIIVEGYTDVLASHQSGVTNVVASSGTALTEGHLELLKRYTMNLDLAFDMDLAGDMATKRGIELALNRGFNVRVIRLPAEKDPGDLAVKDPAAWKQAIQRRQPIVEYFFETSLENRDPANVEDKKKIAMELLPVIKRIGNEIEQRHYVQLLAKHLTVPPDTLVTAMRKLAPPRGTAARLPHGISERKAVRPASEQALEDRFLGLLIHLPEEIEYVLDHFDSVYLETPAHRKLYDLLENFYNTEHQLTEAAFTAYLKKNEPNLHSQVLQFLFSVEKEVDAADNEGLVSELRLCGRLLKRRSLKKKLQELSGQIFAAESAGDMARVEKLSAEFSRLTLELQETEKKITGR